MLDIFAAANWAEWALKMNSFSTFHKMYRSPRCDLENLFILTWPGKEAGFDASPRFHGLDGAIALVKME